MKVSPIAVHGRLQRNTLRCNRRPPRDKHPQRHGAVATSLPPVTPAPISLLAPSDTFSWTISLSDQPLRHWPSRSWFLPSGTSSGSYNPRATLLNHLGLCDYPTATPAVLSSPFFTAKPFRAAFQLPHYHARAILFPICDASFMFREDHTGVRMTWCSTHRRVMPFDYDDDLMYDDNLLRNVKHKLGDCIDMEISLRN